MHLQLRQEHDQRRHHQQQSHAARDFEQELAIMQEEFSMISELLVSVQAEAHMWRERYNDVVRETRQTAASAKPAPHRHYQRPRQPSTESRHSSQSRYSAPAPDSSSPRTRRPSNPAPSSAGRLQSQNPQPWKRDFSAERQHSKVANKRKTVDLPGYVPIRSAPIRSSGYGSPQASKSAPQQPTRPFRRFDPTEWARQRAERLQSPSVSPTRSWVPSSVSPARSAAWSPQRSSRASFAGMSPGRSTTASHRPDRSDWTPRGSPARSSGYGASPTRRSYNTVHQAQLSPHPTVSQHFSPAAARKPSTAMRTPPVRAAPVNLQSSPRRTTEQKSLAERLNERSDDRMDSSALEQGPKDGASGGRELMDANEIQDRLNRLAERLRKARELMR
ncbi:hypothetical protein BCR44DRAFT_1217622 [Catenaria anguillulae PL171]|uniref:Uncharacterized protein n=1 Tax=Catenaria anguillulae PL171 TaxID=765915 RepID=A0A1Y2HZA6_9FUNG|nr:hypothetical protein BCR44DRAFT_1217622 [Catenaria anguillulae PL171]